MAISLNLCEFIIEVKLINPQKCLKVLLSGRKEVYFFNLKGEGSKIEPSLDKASSF